ncbi:TRAP transporter fused permease subunit [Pseudomonadales bacterium]|jgi:TRAP transporter 4TM/12TM fusion protein|nr:TRAP transporter fused permease subunit [Pseudomonadales bacterium]
MTKLRATDGPLGILLALTAVIVSLLAMDSLRVLGAPLLSGIVSLETQYFYLVLMFLMPLGFLLYRSNQKTDLLPLDVLLALVNFLACGWLYWHSEQILDEGWEFGGPEEAVWVSYVLWACALETVRRVAGWSLFILVSLFSLYPLAAEQMPDAISGMSVSLQDTAIYHAMSSESVLGLPFRAFANLVIGFLVFGVALKCTGGGQFFIDLAFSLLGRVRGGPAKVAILSSGLMGSMSGSVVTNVLTTGQLTIPAMKRSGFNASAAGGIEACASTGGVLLPPVMGSTAFVMATFLGMPYYDVALAAAIPAVLYFVALFLQLDAFAARENLQGADEDEIPDLLDTIKNGWYYLGAFAVLVVLLLVMQREALAPWLSTLVLLILNQFSKRHRWGAKDVFDFLVASGSLFVELLIVLSGVGLIVGALSLTGLSGTLVNELLFLAGGSTLVLLLMGALTSFVLGIGMTVTAAYIFLAIVLAPALIQGGLEPLSVHLFILYCGMLSFITPPVALGAFAAASIAGSNPMSTGFKAMQFGVATYCIPFFFVLQPALILNAEPIVIVQAVFETFVGVWLIASGVQGYLPFMGVIRGFVPRVLIATGGLLIAAPGLGNIGIDIANSEFALVGIVLCGLALMVSTWLVKATSVAVDPRL